MLTRWYKYRTIWSHGYGDWEYINIPEHYAGTVRDFFDEYGENFNYSKHFRRMEWKKIKRPPNEYLKDRIKI